MFKALYLLQTSTDMNDAMPFSVGLVVICLMVLLLLWLPDIIKKQ